MEGESRVQMHHREITRDSGLYAMLYDSNNGEIWHSRSTSIRFPGVNAVELGDWQFSIQDFGQKDYFRLVFAIHDGGIRA